MNTTDQNLDDMVKSMKAIVSEINLLQQQLKGPIIVGIHSTKIRTLDSRFIYYHDLTAYKTWGMHFFGRHNREHDEAIVAELHAEVNKLNAIQLELPDGICVDMDSINLESISMKRIQYYNVTVYRKVLL